MYAVIMTGGKQYRVSTGDKLRVETLAVPPGTDITLDKILMIGDGPEVELGKPYIVGGAVHATVLEHGRGKKIRIVKFRRRKHYQKITGHRQNFTELRINTITSAAHPAPPVESQEIPEITLPVE